MNTLEMKNTISKSKKLKIWAYQKICGIPQKITNSKNRSIKCINSEDPENKRSDKMNTV